ncbi:hypothetical protein PUN28_009014 [Cardiocondyla obscurior]|uniref:Uncharacterized protein n=1 Tax=Cardiocondyla obscurior TaxID=286306 RepID=A0AAW2FVS5_9HYME
MSLAMIQRLVLSSCRGKITINLPQRIASSLNVLLEKTVTIKDRNSAHYTCIVRRSFHESAISMGNISPKENDCDIVGNIPALQMKNSPIRRSRNTRNTQVPKPNTWTVKALATAEEYNLEALAYGLLDQQLYIPSKIPTSTNH